MMITLRDNKNYVYVYFNNTFSGILLNTILHHNTLYKVATLENDKSRRLNRAVRKLLYG